jgi:Holliday junction DNA helicase RuvA
VDLGVAGSIPVARPTFFHCHWFMFGKLKGIVDEIEVNHIILDVNGAGYQVHCSAKTLMQAQLGKGLALFIETCVREDQIILYGFMTKQEKECFLELTTVKGIGPKIALQVLNKLTPDQLCVAVNLQDKAVFAGVSGIGPKIIDRIFAELKGRAFVTNFEKYFPTSSSDDAMEPNEGKSLRGDAISVLVNLGINKSEAFTIVSEIIVKFPQYNLNEIIKTALNKMAVR